MTAPSDSVWHAGRSDAPPSFGVQVGGMSPGRLPRAPASADSALAAPAPGVEFCWCAAAAPASAARSTGTGSEAGPLAGRSRPSHRGRSGRCFLPSWPGPWRQRSSPGPWRHATVTAAWRRPSGSASSSGRTGPGSIRLRADSSDEADALVQQIGHRSGLHGWCRDFPVRPAPRLDVRLDPVRPEHVGVGRQAWRPVRSSCATSSGLADAWNAATQRSD